jgi:hypothetical protein
MPEENMSHNAPDPVIPLEYHLTLEPLIKESKFYGNITIKSFSPLGVCCSTNGRVAELQFSRR